MSALKIKDDQGNWINLPGLKGDKGDKGDKGESGVYLGTTAPSDEDINVWINPNGEPHIEAVVVDPTLTMEGQAADAKVTGDKIAKLNTNSSDYCGIENKVFTAQEGNKYLNGNGAITLASGSFHISEPIAVVTNSEVHFIATGHTSSFTMIATCDSEGANIVPRVRAIYGATAEEHEYTYRIIEDGYIMLSYNYSYPAELIILSNTSNAVLNYSINNLKDTVERFCGVEHKSFTNQIGKKYVTGTGVVSTASGTYHVTNPIEVQADTEVHFIARGNTSNFTMISTCASDGTSISAKIGAKSDGEEHDYVYKVIEDGYIILSYNYSYPAELYILSDISNELLKKSVDGLNDAVKSFSGVVIGNNGNLINHRTMTDKKAISTAGVITDNIEYAITDKILLKPSTMYSYRELSRIVFFDSTDTRISAIELYSSTTGTFTTPASVAYGIANIHKATDSSGTGTVYNEYHWQLVEGDTLPDYERQYQTLNGYNIIDNAPTVGGNNYAFRRWNKTCFDRMPVFLVDAESDAVTSEDKTSTAILAKYDALMDDNTGYITKTAIGTASNNEMIYRYDFKMPSITGLSGNAFERVDILPKIICISGVHPEFGGIYGLYNAMREIANNDSLSDLKTGIHFIVIPVVNPYGIANNTRANANGIDMARNYEIDYIANSGSQSQGTWSGLSALSEVEAQIIDGIMADNKDAIMFMSCHSFQKDSKKRVMWGSCATKYMINMVGKTAYKLTNAWKKEYPSFDWNGNDTASVLGVLSLATEPGSEGKQATKYGIQGLTFETSDYFPLESQNPLTAFAISRNSETYINFIRTVLGCWESADPKDMAK